MRSTAPDDRAGSRTHRRRWTLAVLLALGTSLAVTPFSVHAQTDNEPPVGTTSGGGGYVTTTAPTQRSIDVSGFAPVCIRDAPFISYAIVPIGFTPVGSSATLVIRTADGTVLGTETVDSLSGQIIWPGASVDAAGNATDWPGWKLASDGVSWEPDPSDDILREGLTIEVTVDGAPPAIATVDYPPDDSACANPPVPPDTPPTTTTACVPGQDNDDNPSDDCDLATTGGDSLGNVVPIGGAILLAGVAALIASRRRRGAAVPTG